FTPYPVAITGGFLTLGLFFFITGQLPRLRPWRAGVALIGGAAVVALMIIFLHDLYTVYDWNLKTRGAFGQWAADNYYVHIISPGPGLAVALGIGLMIVGAIDLREHL